jgi:hypothetical protein
MNLEHIVQAEHWDLLPAGGFSSAEARPVDCLHVAVIPVPDLGSPIRSIGRGCLVDQLVGIAGLFEKCPQQTP